MQQQSLSVGSQADENRTGPLSVPPPVLLVLIEPARAPAEGIPLRSIAAPLGRESATTSVGPRSAERPDQLDKSLEVSNRLEIWFAV
jgi:hypothetical protein